ncbi:Serine/threonine protein kinase [Polaribacter sp. KT25b]|uniref:serine/threonine-protein kinase n=1 Tax=Polaribacter sp. KT25b TaxID=1855336 RepID=UPI00087C24B6|nr:serine/threonine-protein kinase [Polaribacter sp. KT25b]SDR98979.1 Serine/threonine protein kinase [Polaribacter sp. KT25b]
MTQQEFRKRYEFDLKTDNIGGGSFGTVYKAYDNALDREVAIKVSEVKIVGDKEFSLLEEFKAIENLSAHQNIANYEEVFRFESFPTVFDYGIMQYYSLGNLSHYLKNNEVSIAKREKITKGVLEGIAFLHQHNVVHRDLKPSNILVVDRRGEIIPKITDFGLSKQAEGDGKASRFTNSFAGGTLQYSSPEQLKGLPLKLNTDLWSFGAIAYEILTGKTLFEADSQGTATAEWQNEITQKILHKDLSEELQGLPGNWQKVVMVCLERDLTKRVQNTDELFLLLDDKKTIITSNVNSVFPKQINKDTETISRNNDATIIKGSENLHQDKQQEEEQVNIKSFKPKDYSTNKPKKKNFKFIKTAIAFVLLICIPLGYFANKSYKENKIWASAKQINTKESYQDYLDNTASIENLEEVKQNLDWIKAIESNTVLGFQKFEKDYPKSNFILKLDSLMKSLSWSIKLEKNKNGSGKWTENHMLPDEPKVFNLKNDNILISRNTNSNGNNNIELKFINKYGEMVWTKSFGTSKKDLVYNALTIDKDKTAIIAYNYFSLKGVYKPQKDLWIMLLDKQGDLIWETKFSKDNLGDVSVKTNDKNNIIVSGSFRKHDSEIGNDWLIVLDSKGSKLIDKAFSDTNFRGMWHEFLPLDSNYLLYWNNGLDLKTPKGIIKKLDYNGQVIWEKTLGNYIIKSASIKRDSILVNQSRGFSNGVIKDSVVDYYLDFDGNILGKKSKPLEYYAWGNPEKVKRLTYHKYSIVKLEANKLKNTTSISLNSLDNKLLFEQELKGRSELIYEKGKNNYLTLSGDDSSYNSIKDATLFSINRKGKILYDENIKNCVILSFRDYNSDESQSTFFYRYDNEDNLILEKRDRFGFKYETKE